MPLLYLSSALSCFLSSPLPGPQTLCAYIDPGTGSFIFQILVAGLLGGVYVVRLHVKTLLKRLFSGSKDVTKTKNDKNDGE